MSQTIAVIVKESADTVLFDLKAVFEAVISQHGYGYSYDVELATDEAQIGLRSFVEIRQPSFLGLIRAPADSDLGECWEIGEQLEPGGNPEEFFLFLRDLDRGFRKIVQEYALVFAVNWRENQRFRFSSGSIEDLTSLLQSPCGWEQEIFDARLDVVSCEGEQPLFFVVSSTGASVPGPAFPTL